MCLDNNTYYVKYSIFVLKPVAIMYEETLKDFSSNSQLDLSYLSVDKLIE